MNSRAVNRLIASIKADSINPDAIMRKGPYYGETVDVTPLFCSYGKIGYTFHFNDFVVAWDFDLGDIKIDRL